MMYLFGTPFNEIQPSQPPLEVSASFNAVRAAKGLEDVRLHYITREGLDTIKNLNRGDLIVGKLGYADIESRVAYVVEGEQYGWLEDTVATAIHELMHFYLGVGHEWMKEVY